MTQSAPLPASVLEALGRYDTPTICNAMEIVAPDRRLIGYTTRQLVCPFPNLPPMVGYARTVTIRSVLKSGLPADEQAKRRIAYYEYVGIDNATRIWAAARHPKSCLSLDTADHLLRRREDAVYLADVIAVPSDPSEDVSTTLDVRFVMKDGRIYKGA